MLKSQQVRSLSPEMDPLRMGMGWTVDDLSKPQIMVESTYGNSHPGSGHLNIFVEEAVRGVNDHGGKAARYFATDMCDGMAQGHDGINYSLAHREAITNLVEAQANATTFDGGVFISSCDKAMPAMLMSIGRMKDMMAAIVVTGGVMEAHDLPAKYTENDPGCAINELLTLEQIGKFSAQYERGEIPAEQLTYYKQHACPSCGACSFMGTASSHAGHGRGSGPDAARHRFDAGHCPRAEAGCLRRRCTADEAGGSRCHRRRYRGYAQL